MATGDAEGERVPTAAELGISEGEYARIRRDMAQRGLAAGNVVPIPTAQARRKDARPSIRRPLVVLAVSALVLLALRIGSGSDETGGSYAFMHTTENGRPVTYSSCRPIQIAVYPAGGPSDATGVVREAVQTVRAATGLDIVVVGSYGGAAPNWNFEAAPVGRDDPISISWQNGETISDMTDDVAGIGGSRMTTTAGGTPRLYGGTIALSRQVYARLDLAGDRAEQRAIVMHELGHVFGLDHVSDPGELMYEDNIGASSFGPGDLEGLRQLGQGPCF